MSAVDVIDAYISTLPGDTRRLAHAEWGVSVRTGDWPFDIGLRVEDGLLRAQAMAVDAAHALEPRQFLHWNRSTRLVRFACTKSGDVWVHGDLPVACVDEQAVDRLLGLMAEAAAIARQHAPAPPG